MMSHVFHGHLGLKTCITFTNYGDTMASAYLFRKGALSHKPPKLKITLRRHLKRCSAKPKSLPASSIWARRETSVAVLM